MKSCTLKVALPVYNEELSIPIIYKELKKVLDGIRDIHFSFLFIDDGSNDASLEIIKNIQKFDNNVSYISFSRNFGHQAAVCAAIDHTEADILLVIDADFFI